MIEHGKKENIMAINLKSTQDIPRDHGAKIVVYGDAGIGKTRLIPTLPKPVVLSSEKGLISLSDYDIPYTDIDTIEDFEKAMDWAFSEKADAFESIVIDSITDVGDVILSNLFSGKTKAGNKVHGKQAYGQMFECMLEQLMRIKNYKGKKNFLLIAQLDEKKDLRGNFNRRPAFPGNAMHIKFKHIFDEYFALAITENSKGEMALGLLCTGLADPSYLAKDRSGKLADKEKPDLGYIINKMKGVK
jgi:hypothetical protein